MKRALSLLAVVVMAGTLGCTVRARPNRPGPGGYGQPGPRAYGQPPPQPTGYVPGGGYTGRNGPLVEQTGPTAGGTFTPPPAGHLPPPPPATGVPPVGPPPPPAANPGASTLPGQPHPLPYRNPRDRNWHQRQANIFVSVDPNDLRAKLAGARRAWLVTSAVFLDPGPFWGNFPQFTQKCVISKHVRDFAWIEATPLALNQLNGASEFDVRNTVGVYYAFVLVERMDGSLHDVAVTKIDRVPHAPSRVMVNSAPVRRGAYEKSFWPQCK